MQKISQNQPSWRNFLSTHHPHRGQVHNKETQGHETQRQSKLSPHGWVLVATGQSQPQHRERRSKSDHEQRIYGLQQSRRYFPTQETSVRISLGEKIEGCTHLLDTGIKHHAAGK